MGDAVKPRYGGSKTRSGCVTCKARHVKCDERKPHCLRCEKAGRPCEGYRAPSPRNAHDQLRIVSYVPTPHGRLSAQPGTTLEEQRALSFFQHRTAPEIAGDFSVELWSKFMLLVAQHQSSVKHALIALGSIHEDFVNVESLTQQPASESALQHYGKAIREVLAIRDAKGEDAVEVALISCILFACLESLRGYYQSAITHLLSGMKVLEEEQTTSSNTSHAYIPRAMLRSLFVRMDSQIMNVGGSLNAAGISLARSTQISIPRCYSSADEALNEFEILYNHAIHVLDDAEQVVVDPTALPTTLHELRQETARLDSLRLAWQRAFNAMLHSNVADCRPRDPPCLILHIYGNVLQIMLQVDPVDPECDFDRFVDVFRSIVDDAEEFLSKTSVVKPSPTPSRSVSPSLHAYSAGSTPSATMSNSSPFFRSVSNLYHSDSAPPALAPRPPPRVMPNFSLTMGVVAALYLAAARCRSAPVRHKALSLLKMCNRREGFWDSRIAAAVAERVIAIEETSWRLPQDQQHDVEENALRYSQIPDHMRVKAVDVQFGPEDTGKAEYSLMNTLEAYIQKNRGRKTFNELMRW